MFDTQKYLIPVPARWGKWTGDNLEELKDFWTGQIAFNAEGATMVADPETGNLVLEGVISAFNNVPVGYWAAPYYGMTDEASLFKRWREV